MTRGRAAIAGIMALGLALIATPAQAAEPGDAPVVTATPDSFSAGSWGDGVTVTVSELPDEVTEVTLTVNQPMSPAAEPVTVPAQDGEASGVVDDFYAPPTMNGSYSANASYTYLDENNEQQSAGAGVDLVINEGLAIEGPGEATVGELAEGVELILSGFEPSETLSGEVQVYNTEASAWETIGEVNVTVGEDGSGPALLQITNATAGDRFRVDVVGEMGSVMHWITATEGGGTEPTPEPEPTPETPKMPETPKKPERIETGA